MIAETKLTEANPMNIEDYEHLVPKVVIFVDRRSFPDWVITKSTIDFHDLTFVVGGKADYYINDEKFTVEAGDIIYIPEGSVREAHTFEEFPIHAYAFNFFWQDTYNHVRLPLQTVTKNLITSPMIGSIKEFNQVWMGKQPGYGIQARGLFLLILHRLMTLSSQQLTGAYSDPRITKVKEYIVEHYSEEIDFAEIAKLVKLHPVYLGKLFKQNTSSTYKEFLNQIRINNAEMMLSTGGFTVSEVAERCGYKDISYFSNVFKNIKGFPPSMAIR